MLTEEEKRYITKMVDDLFYKISVLMKLKRSDGMYFIMATLYGSGKSIVLDVFDPKEYNRYPGLELDKPYEISTLFEK